MMLVLDFREGSQRSPQHFGLADLPALRVGHERVFFVPVKVRRLADRPATGGRLLSWPLRLRRHAPGATAASERQYGTFKSPTYFSSATSPRHGGRADTSYGAELGRTRGVSRLWAAGDLRTHRRSDGPLS